MRDPLVRLSLLLLEISDTAVRAVASTLLRHRPTTLVRTVTVIVQQWFDSLADLVSPMSPLGSLQGVRLAA